MRAKYLRKQLLVKLCVLTITLVYLLTSVSYAVLLNDNELENDNFKILYINSYEEGYKWSDDIYDGIKSVITMSHLNINLNIEYMSTHITSSSDYYDTLLALYEQKYKNVDYDLIITSDDAAFNFISQYGDILFPNTPKLFCGVNHYDEEKILKSGFESGVIEGYDIKATIDTSLKFHPETTHVYYVNDTSVTGLSIQKEFDKAIESFEGISFLPFDYEAFEKTKKADLKDNSIIIFLIYTVDSSGNIYDYRYASNQLSINFDTPLYGQWDFSLGEGVIGGNMTSGVYQGETVARQALDVLEGKKLTIKDVVVNKTTQYMFDYSQLYRHGIKTTQLPKDAIVINYNQNKYKQVLILNSYNVGLKVTDDLNSGIKEALNESDYEFVITHEFMNTKTNSHPTYLYNLEKFLYKKYYDKQYDLIITTNDNAYNFIKKHHDSLFPDTPVVYCGVNQTINDAYDNSENFTGLHENIDYKDTIDLGLKLFPDTKEIIIINDKTTTGKLNKKAVDEAINTNEYQVKFTFWEDVNMSDIQELGKDLEKETIMLLLSFTEDKSRNNFTYDESIEMIKRYIDVPIFGVWDFYLDRGIIGGKLLNSYQHGYATGKAAAKILDGTDPKLIQTRIDESNKYMFDNNELERFSISKAELPEGSLVINEPINIIDYYNMNKDIIDMTIFIIVFIVTISLIINVILLRRNLTIKAKIAEKEQYYANTDILTNLPNRRAGLLELEKVIHEYDKNKPITICFIDLNNLKIINDTYGHGEGDNAIKVISESCSKYLDPTQVLCRLGGDEFLMILPSSDKFMTTQKIKLIKKELEQYNKTSDKLYDVSFSIGITSYNPDIHPNINSLIEEADQRMYEDKLKKGN